jgi:hypothetical protein
MKSCIFNATPGCMIVHAEYSIVGRVHAEHSILGPMSGTSGWPTCRKRLIILAGVKAPLCHCQPLCDVSLVPSPMSTSMCRVFSDFSNGTALPLLWEFLKAGLLADTRPSRRTGLKFCFLKILLRLRNIGD